MVEKVKTDVDSLLLVLIMKKKNFDKFCKIELFLTFQTKSCLSTSVSIFSTIFQI